MLYHMCLIWQSHLQYKLSVNRKLSSYFFLFMTLTTHMKILVLPIYCNNNHVKFIFLKERITITVKIIKTELTCGIFFIEIYIINNACIKIYFIWKWNSLDRLSHINTHTYKHAHPIFCSYDLILSKHYSNVLGLLLF